MPLVDISPLPIPFSKCLESMRPPPASSSRYVRPRGDIRHLIGETERLDPLLALHTRKRALGHVLAKMRRIGRAP